MAFRGLQSQVVPGPWDHPERETSWLEGLEVTVSHSWGEAQVVLGTRLVCEEVPHCAKVEAVGMGGEPGSGGQWVGRERDFRDSVQGAQEVQGVQGVMKGVRDVQGVQRRGVGYVRGRGV